MKTTTRLLAIFGLAALTLPGTLAAQELDVRWQPWIGCWVPVAAEGALFGMTGSTARVCVVPVDGHASAVDITTIAAGKVVDRARIQADGQPHLVSADGCTGSETAHWAQSGTRVYMSTALSCAGGVSRSGSRVLSFTERHEWLDVRGVAMGKASGVAVSRFAIAETDDMAGIPAEIRSAVPARTDVTNAAALAASSPLTLADIAEVATSADSGVAATWLMERTRGLRLSISGKQLATLADAGVPAAVIDVAVALAHPAVFGVNPNSSQVAARPDEQRLTGPSRDRGALTSPALSAYGLYGYSPYDSWLGYGYGYNSRMGYDLGFGYRYGAYGYDGYGYGGSPYGSPYYGAYYTGHQPIVVITRPSETNAPSHGRVVKGQGYTSGQGSNGASGRSPSSLTSGGNSGGNSGSGSGTAASGTTSTSSSSGGRTAVKKP